jgi:hypothetical protein
VWPLAVAGAVDFAGGNQYASEHTPYGEGLGELCLSGHQLLWKCNWCPYWSYTIDQRVFEEHLLVTCPSIDAAVRETYRCKVFAHIELSLPRIEYEQSFNAPLLHTPLTRVVQSVQARLQQQPASSLTAERLFSSSDP